jgi:hypothetical protein
MLKFLAIGLIAISFTVATGCSTAVPAGSALYASASGAPVFVRAGAESRLLGRLEPNEQVVKIGEAKGFTHVRARGGSMVGWVSTTKLVRQPSASVPASPAP